MIDVARYDLRDAELVTRCRAALEERGAVHLSGFMNTADAAADGARMEALARSGCAYRAEARHNVLLEDSNAAGGQAALASPGGATHTQLRSLKSCIAGDRVPPDSCVAALYASDELLDFVSAVASPGGGSEGGDGSDAGAVGAVPRWYRTADALGALNVHVYENNDELNWHWDRGELAVTLLLQAPQAGGRFEYVRRPRPPGDACVAEEIAAAVLGADGGEHGGSDGDGSIIECIDLAPGSLLLLRGQRHLHRVTPVNGARARVLAVLSYESKPGRMLNAYTRERFYGRQG